MKVNGCIRGTWLTSQFTESEADRSEGRAGLPKAGSLHTLRPQEIQQARPGPRDLACSFWRLWGVGGWCWGFDVPQNYRLMCVCWTGRWDQSLLQNGREEAWLKARGSGGCKHCLDPASLTCGLLSSKGNCCSRKGGWGALIPSVSAETTFRSVLLVQLQFLLTLRKAEGPQEKYNSSPRWQSKPLSFCRSARGQTLCDAVSIYYPAYSSPQPYSFIQSAHVRWAPTLSKASGKAGWWTKYNMELIS